MTIICTQCGSFLRKCKVCGCLLPEKSENASGDAKKPQISDQSLLGFKKISVSPPKAPCNCSPENPSKVSPAHTSRPENTSHYPSANTSHYPPANTGHYPPENTGHYPPENTGHYPPENTGHYPPENTGHNPPANSNSLSPAHPRPANSNGFLAAHATRLQEILSMSHVRGPDLNPFPVGGTASNGEDFKKVIDTLKSMKSWWEAVVFPEDAPSTNSKANETNEETDEEVVSVEMLGDYIRVILKCQCGKTYQLLVSGSTCFYKLM